MALPALKDLTGTAWKNAKKAAGVKGAGFFDGPGSKAVADKIDKYQARKAAYKQAKTSKNFMELFNALTALETALAKAESDRSFKSDLAKEMQADIGSLLGEIKAKQQKLAVIYSKPEEVKKLDSNNKNELEATIDQFVF
jgi:hypothetical protein